MKSKDWNNGFNDGWNSAVEYTQKYVKGYIESRREGVPNLDPWEKWLPAFLVEQLEDDPRVEKETAGVLKLIIRIFCAPMVVWAFLRWAFWRHIVGVPMPGWREMWGRADEESQ